MNKLPEFYDLLTEQGSAEAMERRLDAIERELGPVRLRPARRRKNVQDKTKKAA